MKIISRILALPFFVAFQITYLSRILLMRIYWFLRFGGEMITYRKEDQKTIYEIYLKLKEQNEASTKA